MAAPTVAQRDPVPLRRTDPDCPALPPIGRGFFFAAAALRPVAAAPLPFRRRPCFDLSMSLQLSDDPRDKLRVVLDHDLPAPDANYRQAVTAWYVALSDHDVLVVARAAHAHGKGDEAAAERYAAALPPARKRPL